MAAGTCQVGGGLLVRRRRFKDAGNGLLVCDGVHKAGIPLRLRLCFLQLLHMFSPLSPPQYVYISPLPIALS
jgi:hypothetical protein